MATTGGKAGWNLCGRSAAGLAGPDFGCGGHETSFLGAAPVSANLWLGNSVCAPPLLRRIAVVGGALMALQREMLSEMWRARRGARSAQKRIAATQLRCQPSCTGRGGGLGCQGTDFQRLTSSNRRGARFTEPAHSRVASYTELEEPNGSYKQPFCKCTSSSHASVAGVGLPLLR